MNTPNTQNQSGEPSDRRQHERFDMSSWAKLSVIGSDSQIVRRLSGHMSDVSRKGLGVVTPEQLEVGTQVVVSFLGRKALNSRYAIVRRNTAHGGYTAIGVEFQVCPEHFKAIVLQEQSLAHSVDTNPASDAA